MQLLTEAEFSKSFTAKLNKSGMRTTRIESHATGNGIPDLFTDGHGFDCYIELKNDQKLSIQDNLIRVKWRPGQQAWMYEYFLKHEHKKCCLTIVACSDGMFIIPMTHVYVNNTVCNPQAISYSDFHKVSITKMLAVMTTHYKVSYKTYRDAVISMVDEFWPVIRTYSIDYDPEVLWDSNNIDDKFDGFIFEAKKLSMFKTIENTKINLT